MLSDRTAQMMRRIATTTPMTIPTMAPVSSPDPPEESELLLAGGATVTVAVGDIVVWRAKIPAVRRGRVLVGGGTVGAMMGGI